MPYGGYTVVRIHTGSPGYWLMHCHQMMHATEGMDVVVRVAPEKAPKPPPRFPMNCGNYEFTHEEFQKYLIGDHNQGGQGTGSGLNQCNEANSEVFNHILLMMTMSSFLLTRIFHFQI